MLPTDSEPPSLTTSVQVTTPTTDPESADAPASVAAPAEPASDDLVVDLTTYETKPAEVAAVAGATGAGAELPVADIAEDGDGSSKGRARLWIGLGSVDRDRRGDRARGRARLERRHGGTDEEDRVPGEQSPLGTVRRKLEVGANGHLVGTIKIKNTTKAPTTGRYTEVVPKALAASSEEIRSTPKHVVIKKDPVIGWISRSSREDRHDHLPLDVPKSTTTKQLAAWKTQQAADLEAFTAEQAAVPALTILTPQTGTSITTGEVDVGARPIPPRPSP